MRVHRCNWIGCMELVPQGDKFCPIHQVANDKHREHYQAELSKSLKGTMRQRHLDQHAQVKYDAEVRDQDATAFYHSKRWVKLSRYVKVKASYTSAISGKVLSDTDCQIDHIVKRSLLPRDEQFNQDNLWLISRHEHSIKTAIENKMVRDGKSNVLKHLDKQWWTKVIREKLNE